MVEFANLDKVPLFAGLDDKQLAWLKNHLYARTFPAGVDVIVAGAIGEVIYILLEGTVKVYVPQLNGSDVIVTILGPGDTVGEMSLVDHDGRSASVVTLEESTVLWMNHADFEEAIQTIPHMARNLLQVFSNRLRSTTNQFQVLAALKVDGRVAWQILTFARKYGKHQTDGSVYLPLRLTQSELAELVGASRKRVNQVMGKLKQLKLLTIDPEYRITILDWQGLEDLCAC